MNLQPVTAEHLCFKGQVFTQVEMVRKRMGFSFTQLTIDACRFNKPAWNALCAALSQCALTAVKVTHCILDDQDVKRFMNGLKVKSHTTLTILHLEGNSIKATGIPYITDFAQVAPALKELSLANNGIDNLSVLALTLGLQPREAPIDLNLSNNSSLTHDRLPTLLKRVRCLNRLNLNGNKHVDCMLLFSSACRHLRLKRLSLLDTKISKSSYQKWLSAHSKIIIDSKKKTMQVDFPFKQLNQDAQDQLIRLFDPKHVCFSVVP